MDPFRVTLGNVADGVAEEYFTAALKQVLENIRDPNTDHKAKQKIVLTVTMVSDEDRVIGAVQVACATKLAGVKPHAAMIHIGTHHWELVAVSAAKQSDMFKEPVGKPTLAERAAAS